MRPVIYSMSVSVDGFIAGPGGEIDWGNPDAEEFRFHVQQIRELGAYLSGRRLYEEMLVWEAPADSWPDPDFVEFAKIWQAIPKVIFSATLDHVQGNARLASGDVAAEVARVKELPGPGAVAVGGAGLASTLIKLDLIDEYRLFVKPVVLGGGTSYFPPRDQRLSLELKETRTFGSRVVYQRYQRV
jgi:dihydrofolate reductase